MAYSRREVINNKTVIDKELYDNLQDGIDESFEKIEETKEYVKNNSGVTASDGTPYRWGKDENGVYLEQIVKSTTE